MVALAETAEGAAAEDPGRVVAAFAALEAEGRASLNAMRDLLGRLRSDTWAERAPLPTLDGLDGLVETARADGRTVALDVEGPRRPLVGGVELAAYRLVQHALGAAGRGAVRVRLRYRADALDLEVGAESGVAAEPLAVVRERVRAHGGRLTVETSEPGGTLLRAELPAARA
jgi:signal transduction histidine kinase